MIDQSTGWYFVHASAKVVILDGPSTLLALNPRDEWELIGGWPDKNDHNILQTLEREAYEEAEIEIENVKLIDAALFEPVQNEQVALIIYSATVKKSKNQMSVSAEHKKLQWFPVDDLPNSLPNPYVQAILKAIH